MTFDGIAYGPEEHLLLTIDGPALLAHDAQTEAPKWAASFPQLLAAVLYVDADAFPAVQSASPWRSSAAMRWVVAVDVDGNVHVVDAAGGQIATTFGPFGKPTAVAAGAGGRFALGTADRVHIWRNGERTELPDRPSALAFSIDGATLAIGAADGALRFLSVAGTAENPAPVETFCAVVHGGVTDVEQHPGGTWIVSGRTGVWMVSGTGPQRLASLPANVSRVRLDARGTRLAIQLSDRAVSVFAWPGLQLDSRIEYIERTVRGIAFGPANWLGIGLDHGDGNKIDIVTSATHRTDTHPGRFHRSWMLSVRGREAIMSAKEADDIRRMKDPFHVPAPQKGSPTAGRIGIGAVLSIGLLALRLCALGARSSPSYSYTPPPLGTTPFGALSDTTTPKCDIACAKTRIGFLQVRCAEDETCVSATGETLAALRRGDCRGAESAFNRIKSFGVTSGSSSGGNQLDVTTLNLARSGLDSACGSKASLDNLSSKHAMLVRLAGPALTVTTEDIPRANDGMGENAGRIWTAPDGTIFVTTFDDSRTRSNVYRRDPDDEAWHTLAERRSTRVVELWGKSANDLTFMDVDSLAHFDGLSKSELKPPARATFALGGVGDDLLVVGAAVAKDDEDAPTADVLYRKRLSQATQGTAGDWKVEPVGTGVSLDSLWSGGTSVWATGSVKNVDGDTEERLYQRAGAGKWVERKWWGAARRPVDDLVRALWVSPTSDAFVATGSAVYRSTGGGASFSKTPDTIGGDVKSLWGRSSSDVFAATSRGIYHYDGKAWSKTSYTQEASAVSGTATDVLVLVTSR